MRFMHGGARTLRRDGSCVLLDQALLPVVDLSIRLILGDAIGLLNPTDQLLAAAIENIQIVMGQFAPPLLGLTLELLPVALDSVPIHCRAPVV
jgi:hypothetical protein